MTTPLDALLTRSKLLREWTDACLASLSHDGRHLGEIEYIKGLQGVPGTATV